jgi:carboxypeptidase family protein
MVTRPTVFLRLRVWRRLTCVALGLVCVAAPVCAQRASLHGQVIDQNGAIVVGAKVMARASGGQVKTTTTDSAGFYSFANLPPGEYSIEASAPSLVLQEPVKLTMKAGPQSLNLQLSVFIPEQKITVQENNRPAVSTEAAANASAQVPREILLAQVSASRDDTRKRFLRHPGVATRPLPLSGSDSDPNNLAKRPDFGYLLENLVTVTSFLVVGTAGCRRLTRSTSTR